ncbi:MAG: 3-dehydroquinate dehydratase, type [Bacteroidetes bacterium]|uniref:type II 3-dehydroquinate dehydratase n=1 Tax=Chitinophaga TaxID=79328 RepID=UPI0009D1149F|nr:MULTISPECIES: type II 3-dehydroquinate dehydratase [Chitinophaga]MBP1653116.1 3-dehydroquinate dehydratase, type [Bacteroidota bacterium]OMP79087.1 type II 3-dehydroquinate dehydratase [[Flexibacter] sp. ATCC 35208]WPQ65706.1 type II 3-dehydroquinate dehydratase [Chitinophaga sancti]WPV70142.1 type II 3-dehydroquinate dehydratase [Chitinophaga sp. LS1]
MKIAIINGPNLNLLGKREPGIYGNESFEDYFVKLKQLFADVELEYFQNNSEGNIIDILHEIGFTYDGILLNAGAYTHYSIAIRDAIAAIKTPVLEIHISNVHAREEFRHTSVIAPVCKGTIAGLGMKGYALGINYFL